MMKWRSGDSTEKLRLAGSSLSRLVGLLISAALMILVIVSAIRMSSSPDLRKSDFVGQSYFTHPGYLLSTSSVAHALNFAVVGIYLLSTMLLGKWQLTSLRKVFPSLKHFDFLPGTILGFIPGYLTFVALSRLLTLFIPKNIFTIAILIICALIILLSLDQRIKTWNSTPQAGSNRKHFLVLLVFISVWLITYQFAFIHIIGDGALYFLGILNSYSAGTAGYKLPIMGQHYDEALYLLPILGMVGRAERNYLDWFWLLYAFGKTSVLLWIYGSLKSILKESLLPAVLSAIMFFGFLNPNPLSRVLFTDSAAGIAISLHMGRAITLALAFLGVSMLLNSQRAISTAPMRGENSVRVESRFLTIASAFILGLGFTSLTASAAFTLGLLALMALIARSSVNRPMSQSIYPILLTLSATLALAENSKAAGMVFLLLIVWGFARLRIEKLSFAALLSKIPGARVPLAFIFGALVGYLFLGNLFAKKVYGILGMSGNLYEDRGIYATISKFGPNPFLGRYPFYSQGTIFGILELYGLPIFVFAFTYAVIRYYKLKMSPAEENVIYLSLLFFAVTLFLYAFMNGATTDPNLWITVWVKTRLVDPWFYLLMSLPLAIIAKKKFGTAQEKSLQMPILVISLTYLLVLLVGLLPGGPAGQIFLNASHLLRSI